MMNRFCKLLSIPLLSMTLLTTSSCSCNLENWLIIYKPLKFNLICQKGVASLAFLTYYEDEKFTFTDSLESIENSFKDDSNYQMIVYDSVRGLDLCKEYGNYAYVATIAMGNQQFIPLKNLDPTSKSYKVLTNNEFGSAGKTLNKIDKFDVDYLSYNDLEFYNYLFSQEGLENDYDYVLINEPYATRLMTLKESKLYNEKYANFTLNDDRGDDYTKEQYCNTLRDAYLSYNDDLNLNDRGIPQCGLFVNLDYYNNNIDAMYEVFDYLNSTIDLINVRKAANNRIHFREMSEEYNDPNEDPNSEQTYLAYKYQFDTVGISWNETSRLQAWHLWLGEDAPYEKFINRLEYVKNIFTYYDENYLKGYYQFINEEFPEQYYLKLSN